MTVIMAMLAPSPIAGFVNPAITSDLGGYEVDYWLPHERDLGVAPAASLARPGAVAAASRAIAGMRARGYGDDYYDRMHVRPDPLRLGNLVSTQVRDIEVWNAWRDRSQTLDEVVATDAEGIDVVGPGGTPMVFAPLQARTWVVTVALNGPPSIVALLSWHWAAAPDSDIAITGDRVTAWSWSPDWSGGVIETLSWLTSVARSRSGAEQRRSLRLSPRATFEFDAYARGAERTLLDLALFDASPRRWGLPIWHDVEHLVAPLAQGAMTIPTAGARDYHDGGQAMLLGATALDYEMVEIDTVGTGVLHLAQPLRGGWPAGTRLYPMRVAWLVMQGQADDAGASSGAIASALDRLTDDLWRVRARLQLAEPYDVDPAMPTATYRGAPVLEPGPDESDDLAVGVEAVTIALDGDVGGLSTIDTAGLGFPTQAFASIAGDRAGARALRALIWAFRGRAAALWVPTFAADLQLVVATLETDTTLRVRWCGYTRFARARIGRRDLRIEPWGAAPIYRRVVDSTELDATTEQLELDEAIGAALVPADVRRISFMAYSRLSSDDVEIQHPTDGDGITSAKVLLRALRDDLELA